MRKEHKEVSSERGPLSKQHAKHQVMASTILFKPPALTLELILFYKTFSSNSNHLGSLSTVTKAIT